DVCSSDLIAAALAQFRLQRAPVQAACAVGQGAALAAEPAGVRGMVRIALDAGDAGLAIGFVRTADQHAAADAAVAAGRARAALLRLRDAGAVHQAIAPAVAVSDAGPAACASSSQTSPSRNCTAWRRAQPTSGAQAWPLSSAMFQPCSGQVTLSPDTMPCDSGPPLCGQRSVSANTRSAAGRNSAMLS